MDTHVKQIWSLSDMLAEMACAYHDLGGLINGISVIISGNINKLSPEQINYIIDCLKKAALKMKTLDMSVSHAFLVDNILSRLEPPLEITRQQFAFDNLRTLPNVIMAELKTRKVYRLTGDGAQYYENSALFGAEVSQEFPDIALDIKEAGNCYALDRWTACVLHLMRVLEHGLKRLATDPVIGPKIRMKEPRPTDTMGMIVTSLKSAIDKWAVDTEEDKSEKNHLSSMASYLESITQEWRNATIHTNKSYDPNSAKLIMINTEALMRRLAALIGESRRA